MTATAHSLIEIEALLHSMPDATNVCNFAKLRSAHRDLQTALEVEDYPRIFTAEYTIRFECGFAAAQLAGAALERGQEGLVQLLCD